MNGSATRLPSSKRLYAPVEYSGFQPNQQWLGFFMGGAIQDEGAALGSRYTSPGRYSTGIVDKGRNSHTSLLESTRKYAPNPGGLTHSRQRLCIGTRLRKRRSSCWEVNSTTKCGNAWGVSSRATQRTLLPSGPRVIRNNKGPRIINEKRFHGARESLVTALGAAASVFPCPT